MPAALRLTVLLDGDRRDLVVPAGLRAAELVPELARGTARDGATCVGRVLVRADGTPVQPGEALDEQVVDGDVLALVPAGTVVPRDVVDDPVDAVRSVLAERRAHAPGRSALAPALVAASTALAAGGVLLGRSPARGVLLGVLLVLLVLLAVGGVLVARRGRDRRSGLAAVGGAGALALALLLPGAGSSAGCAARLAVVLLLVSGALLVGSPGPRGAVSTAAALAVPGAVLLAGSAALVVAPTTSAQVAAVLAVGVVVLARAVPWAAVSAGRLERATQVRRAGDRAPDAVGGIDLALVAAAVDRTQELVRAAVLGLGATLALLAPVVVRGVDGVLLVGCLGTLLLLLGRAPVEPGLARVARGTAALTLVVAAGTALVAVPGAAPALAVPSGATALVALGGELLPRRPRVPARGVAALEVTLLVLVLPLLALDLGLLPVPAWWAWRAS